MYVYVVLCHSNLNLKVGRKKLINFSHLEFFFEFSTDLPINEQGSKKNYQNLYNKRIFLN